jgi:SPP1 gp7 family putative phage head morphogenesis protein
MPDLVSVNEILADDLRARAVELLRFAPTVARDALKLLAALERELVARLATVGLDGAEASVYQTARMSSLLRQVRATISSTYSGIDKSTTDTLVELADMQSSWAASTINDRIGISLASAHFAPQQLRAIVSNALVDGAPSAEWWSRQAGDLLHRFTSAMRTGLVSGETNSQLIQRVRGTRKNNFSDGIMAVPRRNAEALVRSSAMAVANKANVETYRQNADVVGALLHVSTLDSRTTLVCVARSGMRWSLDGTPLGTTSLPYAEPPLHWNCRSILVPITKTFRELGLDVDEVPAGTRASIDGQVPADLSFNEWLRDKSEAFQDELLGPGRAALWRKGQISLTDLVDQRDRPLTIEQLKKLKPRRS